MAALPGMVMLALFYSLAIHMHHALGGWPASIGEGGFPPTLVAHCTVTWKVFKVLILGLFISPLPILACLLVERWRRFAIYFAVYAGAVIVCFAITQLAAPAQFLRWWWD